MKQESRQPYGQRLRNQAGRATARSGRSARHHPRGLPEFFIRAFTDPGDAVWDPFCGSGTTLAAAYGLGRSAFGCEISPAYTDVICKRIEKLSSQNFRLAGDGRTFTEMEVERKGIGTRREVAEA